MRIATSAQAIDWRPYSLYMFILSLLAACGGGTNDSPAVPVVSSTSSQESQSAAIRKLSDKASAQPSLLHLIYSGPPFDVNACKAAPYFNGIPIANCVAGNIRADVGIDSSYANYTGYVFIEQITIQASTYTITKGIDLTGAQQLGVLNLANGTPIGWYFSITDQQTLSLLVRSSYNYDFAQTGPDLYEAYNPAIAQVNELGQASASQVGTWSAPVVATPTLIDPVPDLLIGDHITPCVGAPSTLSECQSASNYSPPFISDVTKGFIVQGIAADGVAQIIIGIPTNSVGQTMDVGVQQSQCASLDTQDCLDQYGEIFDPTNPPIPLYGTVSSTFTIAPITVTSVSTTSGPMAFVAYRAPLDFARPNTTDSTAAQRSVNISMTQKSTETDQVLPVTIVRPPLVFIHGLSSTACSWASFTPLITNSKYSTFLLNYDEDIDDQVTSTDPPYPNFRKLLGEHVNSNLVGVDWNSHLLMPQLQDAMLAFKTGRSEYTSPCDGLTRTGTIAVAAAQADIIGHSMGGLIGRSMWYQTDFVDSKNYGRGYIHKLITIGTPHLGSDNARRLLDGTNDCVRNTEPWGGWATGSSEYAFTSVTINGKLINGATEDLVGDGTIQGASAFIKSIQQPLAGRSDRYYMALIAGEGSQAQFLSIDNTIAQRAIQNYCGTQTIVTSTGIVLGTRQGDFLADNFTGTGWKNVFGGLPSDALVSRNSALNGLLEISNCTTQQTASCVISSAVHGHGTVDELHFGSPHLQDTGSGAPAAVEDLLNSNLSHSLRFVTVP